MERQGGGKVKEALTGLCRAGGRKSGCKEAARKDAWGRGREMVRWRRGWGRRRNKAVSGERDSSSVGKKRRLRGGKGMWWDSVQWNCENSGSLFSLLSLFLSAARATNRKWHHRGEGEGVGRSKRLGRPDKHLLAAVDTLLITAKQSGADVSPLIWGGG